MCCYSGCIHFIAELSFNPNDRNAMAVAHIVKQVYFREILLLMRRIQRTLGITMLNLSILKRLIAFGTTNNQPEELKRCLNFIVKTYASKAVAVRRWKFHDKPMALLAPRGIANPRVLLYAHADVVHAPASHFILRKRGGRLFGRGVNDMKSFIVVFGELIEEWSKLPHPPSCGMLVTSDEEIGGFDGSAQLMKKRLISPKLVIMPDGGANWRLVCEEKAVLHLELIGRGTSAHGSRPWLGDNAVEKLFEYYQAIENRWNKARAEGDGRPSVNLGTIHAGMSLNMVPREASMGLDIRAPRTEDADAILHWIRTHAPRRVSVKALTRVRHSAIDYTSGIPQQFRSFAQSFLRRPVPLVKASGSSDARLFTARDIPVIITAPISGDAHTENEWINLTSLEQYKNLIREYINNNNPF